MSKLQLDRYLGPPPRLVAATEALPYFGGLALAPYRGELPDELAPHAVERLEDAFDDEAAQKMLRHATTIKAVQARLKGNRVQIIGVSRRGELAKGERRTHLVVAYDYASDVALEISLDEQGELIGMQEERYQPPPIQVEIERAIELARADARLGDKAHRLVATAIPFAGPMGELRQRRVLEVMFGCRAHRLPKYRAVVDLGAESVIDCGEVGRCCGAKEGNHE